MKKIIFSAIVLVLLGCGQNSFLDDTINELGLRTGWLASQEKLDNIPQDITPFSESIFSLPPSYSIENKFPPIGDQGQYGTCVAWAVGYSMKTALNGIERNWTSSDLRNSANQTSPKDLWHTIPVRDKGLNCNGTNFEPAFDALISKGAQSLSQVPYSNMGNCSGASNGNASNKLANYRKIAYNNELTGQTGKEGMDLGNFKGYIAQGRPIAIGARLGDRFMRWNSSAVISSDTYNDPGMQHAYHAMVLVGYDDSREAFRVLNSWGPSWGDRGSIWV
ncbi:MAG: C1 family peptidase, partial [Fibromonadales bacterium]|nr:C1 family peptidase [Fibromonadales bacterium]